MSAPPAIVPRVPLVLPPLEEEKHGLSQEVWQELNDVVKQEAQSMSTTGKFSPQRRSDASPKMCTRDDHNADPNSQSRSHTPCLVGLRKLFYEAGRIEADPLNKFPALAAFQCAAQSTDPHAVWYVEDELQRRIRLLNEDADEEMKKRRENMKALMREQQPKKSQHEVFIEQYNQSNLDARLDAEHDKIVMDRIEHLINPRRFVHDDGDEKKQAILKRKEERAAAREARLRHLLCIEHQQEEEMAAIARVKAKWDTAKKKFASTGNEAALEF